MSCQTKDCGCLPEIHMGAHWLHMDRLTARMNRKIYDRAVRDKSALGLYAFAKEEEMRLHTKLYEMKARGIERHCSEETTTEAAAE